jgi:hypothetical protein
MRPLEGMLNVWQTLGSDRTQGSQHQFKEKAIIFYERGHKMDFDLVKCMILDQVRLRDKISVLISF